MGLRVSPEAYDETAYTSTLYMRRRGGPVDLSCASGGESILSAAQNAPPEREGSETAKGKRKQEKR